MNNQEQAMTDLRARLAEVAKEIRSDGQYRLKIQGATNHGNRLIAWADSLAEVRTALDRALEDAERVPALEAALAAESARLDRVLDDYRGADFYFHYGVLSSDPQRMRAAIDAARAKG